jgi:tetratricopeptide (TPR) repeat protein
LLDELSLPKVDSSDRANNGNRRNFVNKSLCRQVTSVSVGTNIRAIEIMLLVFGIFAAPIRTSNAQTPNYTELRAAGFGESYAGNFEKAETMLRNALEAAELSGDDYAVATVQNALGDIYQNEERLIEAERAYLKAVSIFSLMPGKNYDTALALRNLGSAYSLDRRDSDALKVLQEASGLIKKDTPDEQVLATQILNSMAIVYFRKGKTGRAEALLIESMRIRPVARVPLDLADANILNNLGMVYRKQHKYAKAEESYRRSLEITEQLLGFAHPDLVLTLSNLGGLYIEMRRYREAEDYYRRSLAMLEEIRPIVPGKIQRTLHNLSKAYLRRGEKTSAEKVLAQAVDTARRNPVDRETTNILDAYADVLKSLGKLEDARRVQAEARRARANTALTVRAPKP